jgi:hypothetical protein
MNRALGVLQMRVTAIGDPHEGNWQVGRRSAQAKGRR